MKISIWTILTFIGLGLHSINSEILRPKFGGQDELIGFILGVAPNFLAAGLIFPFGVLMIAENYNKETISKINNYFWFGLVSSQVGLIVWEFMQESSEKLVFDLNDITVTLFGGLFAIGIYQMNKKRYLRKKTAHNNGYK